MIWAAEVAAVAFLAAYVSQRAGLSEYRTVGVVCRGRCDGSGGVCPDKEEESDIVWTAGDGDFRIVVLYFVDSRSGREHRRNAGIGRLRERSGEPVQAVP